MWSDFDYDDSNSVRKNWKLDIKGIILIKLSLHRNSIVPDVTMMYIRRWMQMVYCHMIYSPETEQIYITWHFRALIISTHKVINIHNVLCTLCTVGPLRHTWLFFPSSLLLHEAVVPSSAGDPLLILFSAWGARPSPIPPTQVDPISLTLQAPSHFSVGCWIGLGRDINAGLIIFKNLPLYINGPLKLLSNPHWTLTIIIIW